jgi:hypothetical protein
MQGRPKDIRRRAGVSQLRVAADTNTSQPTVRLYEADREAVSPEKQAALDPYYEELAAKLGEARVG